MTDAPTGIDPRGPRFTAAITVVVLVAALLVAPIAPALATAQGILFLVGVLLGVQRTPTGLLFRTLVRPRLTPPGHLEDPRPPRFAQGVGLVFMAVAVAGFAVGLDTLALVAIGMALVAALLNAAVGFCLGCEMYLLGLRLTHRAAGA